MPCLALGSFGVSTSHSVPELLFWRATQAAGGSAGISTGMAIIGDIYKLEERGTAMGITLGVRMRSFCRLHRLNVEDYFFIGSPTRACGCPADWRNCRGVRFIDPLPSGSNVIDGETLCLADLPILICRYASWRLMQAGVGFAALLTFALIYTGMPETSHPGTRGVDKKFGGEFKWVWLNPFKCLWFMRSPNLLALVSLLLSGSQTMICEAVGGADAIGTVHARHSLGPRLFCLTSVRTFRWDSLAALRS
jgi:hypothetical protein